MVDIAREKKRLEEYQAQRKQHEESLARIDDLITKTEAKRASKAESERNYDDILSNLATAHRQTKADIIDTTKLIDRVENRIERAVKAAQSRITVVYDEEDAKDSEVTAPAPAKASREEQSEAVRLLASTAIANLNKVPLETLALAQEYIDGKRGTGSLSPHDAQIAARLEVAAQSERHREPTDAENRGPKGLREAIDLVAKEKFMEMTLEQIELVANCHALLSRKTTLVADDVRILSLISPPLLKLSRIFSNLQAKMRK